MGDNPLVALVEHGQSIWLDYLRRRMITSGELDALIEEDLLRGMTSNPSIFEKAIAGSGDYDEQIRDLAREGLEREEILTRVMVEDVQRAADRFRPVYEQAEGRDGFVSLEVSPHLARDTQGTLAQARELWEAVGRPNVMIKVPATREGLPAIQRLTGEGINVNVTLLFAVSRYEEVALAYLSGLEARRAEGQPIDHIASVASFFLSRIDVLVDPMLEEIIREQGPAAGLAASLRGQVAIASAKAAYQRFLGLTHSERFRQLAQEGGHPQRLLWASTSTKNPEYSDVRYVEALIGPETVNTLPLETLHAYRDHGDPKPRLERGIEEAEAQLAKLEELGIDLAQATRKLEEEGVEKFAVSYDRLLEALKSKREEALQGPGRAPSFELGGREAASERALARLKDWDFAARLWEKDPSLWTEDPEEEAGIKEALGWLHVAEKMEGNLAELESFRREVVDAGFRQVVLLGMGGSSLAPRVFAEAIGQKQGGLSLTVLDTTDAATIKGLQARIPLEATLFLVASKSGTTAETLALTDYFYAQVREKKGDQAGQAFVAITDPGTPLVEMARARGFRRVFTNYPDIGGRYSALSYFGLLPAALLGIDLAEILERAGRMLHACISCVPSEQNPGIRLGAAVGSLALEGRDKLTLLVPERLESLGMWLEQLIAESTGKAGKGILPIAGESLGDPAAYGEDRVFVFYQLEGLDAEDQGEVLQALARGGHPVIQIDLDGVLDMGAEFMRWEVATATAGALLGIHPFNQPNVQESKDNTNGLLRLVEERGSLPALELSLQEGRLALYGTGEAASVVEALRAFLQGARPGDYVAITAYLAERREVERSLGRIRTRLRDELGVATTLGYGPRYLHSTGQLHKGGPDTGLFLQLTAEGTEAASIPGRSYGFETLMGAQAQGDFEALRERGRRVIRVDLQGDLKGGLKDLEAAMKAALR